MLLQLHAVPNIEISERGAKLKANKIRSKEKKTLIDT